MNSYQAALAVLLLTSSSFQREASAYKFALCPKSIDNPFFDVSRDGCYDRAKFITAKGVDEVECWYIGPTDFNPDGVDQAAIVESILSDVDGLSISVTNPDSMRPVIEKALAMGLPVVTYDSDDPASGRASYIGTDNFFFGQQLGKVLKKIEPIGGRYAIITDSTPNILDRERGVRDFLKAECNGWQEISVSPINMQGNPSLAIDLMRQLIQTAPGLTAIVPVMGGPMFLPEEWNQLVEDFPDITLVVGDDLAVQLEFLSRGKVQGLVGQLPYEMGVRSMDSLLQLVKSPEEKLQDFQGTNVLEHLKIPLFLPELVVNENLLGALTILGFTLFSIIAVSAIVSAAWTFKNRDVRVIKAAQPEFLCMLAFGILVMGATIIPLSFDDSSANYTEAHGTAICMSVPWLAFLGFTITISALSAKTWRVNRLFQNNNNFERTQVASRDVILPFVILLTSNVIVLLTWTLVDPVYFVRKDSEGTDAWNRVIATYGSCVSDNPLPYTLTLAFLNIGMLMGANYQAYRARGIRSEFAEAKYIGIAMVAMLQATLIGAPLLFLVKELPQAWYLTLCFMIFITCMVILLLIFVPKVLYARQFVNRSDASQRRVVRNSIHVSQIAVREQNSGGASSGGRRKSLVDSTHENSTSSHRRWSLQGSDSCLPSKHQSDLSDSSAPDRFAATGLSTTDVLPPMEEMSAGDDDDVL